MVSNSPPSRPSARVGCAGRGEYRPEAARGGPLNRKIRRPSGAGASGQGGSARPRKACWRIFAARRKQALRGSRVRPPGLCLNVAHPRYRGTRGFPGRRGLAGHALMPTHEERPWGARAISRPFLGGGAIFSRLPNESMRADRSCF